MIIINWKTNFKKTARYWAQHYANAPGEKDSEMTRCVRKLKDMGVEEVLYFDLLTNPSFKFDHSG
jgi:hypothetical protein